MVHQLLLKRTLKATLLSSALFASSVLFANDHLEDAVMSALSDLQNGRPAAAQKTLKPLLEREPTFRLARLLYADSLNAQRGGPMSFQSASLNKEALDGLLSEAKQRSKFFHASKNIQGKLPFALIKPDAKFPYLVFVDMGLSRVFLYEQKKNGELSLLNDFYASGGKLGNRKQVRGDKRTPLGVYHITSRLPGEELEDKYGRVAFPINYPNTWDKLKQRTGDGIWLHGVTSTTYSRPPLDSDGCIALPNAELKELEDFLSIGMPVIVGEDVQWLDASEHQNLQSDLLAALEKWRQDWESQNSTAYISNYALDFKTEKHSFKTWSAYKARVNSAKEFIKVEISEPVIYGYPDQDNMVQIDFVQNYQSNNINGKVLKRQYWQKQTNDVWKIIYEGTIKRL